MYIMALPVHDKHFLGCSFFTCMYIKRHCFVYKWNILTNLYPTIYIICGNLYIYDETLNDRVLSQTTAYNETPSCARLLIRRRFLLYLKKTRAMGRGTENIGFLCYSMNVIVNISRTVDVTGWKFGTLIV